MKIEIRNEQPWDYREVEEMTKRVFWNLYTPGGNEHYVLHSLRGSPDFIPELDFVATDAGRIVGNIVFTRSSVIGNSGVRYGMLTFGPMSVLPEYQGKGIGTALLKHAMTEASTLGYKAIIIMGDPDYYGKLDFKPAKDFGISDEHSKYPAAMLAYELYPNALKGVFGAFFRSEDFHISEAQAEQFDKNFPQMEKGQQPSQEKFRELYSRYL